MQSCHLGQTRILDIRIWPNTQSPMPIRNLHPGDEPALRAVFYSSVHDLARRHYTAEQLAVWAPRQYDVAQWGERLRGNRPFIAEVDGCIAGFADLQDSGCVDHFCVAGACAGPGAGERADMQRVGRKLLLN